MLLNRFHIYNLVQSIAFVLTMTDTEEGKLKKTKSKTVGTGSEVGESSRSSQDHSQVEEVFHLFKSYLQDKLEEKDKQIDKKNQIEKQVTQLRFKGNQKQYEFNAQIESILENIEKEVQQENSTAKVLQIIQEGKALVHKRQKLIRIADKSKDGWTVVEEYESDELASGSEDEKRLRKAREAASRKRKFRYGQYKSDNKKMIIVFIVVSFSIINPLRILCDFSMLDLLANPPIIQLYLV